MYDISGVMSMKLSSNWALACEIPGKLASFIAYFLFQEKLSPATYVAFVFTSIAILNLFWPQIKYTKPKLIR
jgi:hypothetical protein